MSGTTSGTLEHLTPKQADALKELKVKLAGELMPNQDDRLLLRFLRAKRFDVKKTEIMFRKHLAWRAENRIDTIHDWYKIPEVCLKYYPGGAVGLDKEGHIIWITPMGNIDPKGLLYSAKASDIINTNICIFERLLNEQQVISKKLGRYIEGITMILDLEGLGTSHVWKPAMAVMSELMLMLDRHYPSIMHQVFIVRPTKVFPAVYFVLKPYLSDDTIKRVRLLGGNWKETLLKHIDAESLPVHWGGTMTDPDGNPNMCPSKINLGGKVPKSYYRKDTELSHPDMTSLEIPGNKATEVKFKVTKHDSIFRYEFKTKSHDISFGIYRRLDGGHTVPIVAQRRYNSHIVPEDGEILFDEPGLYIIRFDNKGTFQKTRKLDYWMEVIEPDVDDQVDEMIEGATASGSGLVRDSGFYHEDRLYRQLGGAGSGPDT